MLADSNILTPVLGSSRYGTWNCPVRVADGDDTLPNTRCIDGQCWKPVWIRGVRPLFCCTHVLLRVPGAAHAMTDHRPVTYAFTTAQTGDCVVMIDVEGYWPT